jgi:PAS domain S-box-containing protein
LRDEKNQLDTERELRHSLQQSEKKYRLLIERSNDGILLTSPDGFIKLVNKRFTEMVGKNEEELLGQNILDYAAPAQRKMIEQEWQRRERGVSSSYELDLVKPVGSAPLTLIFSESPVFNRKNEHIANLAVLTDITDKKRAEEEIKHQNEEMFAVKAIAETANQSLILEEIFEATARKIYETLKLDGCLVASINEKARELNIRASIGFSPEFINDDSIKRIPLGVGFAGKAAEDGELVVIDDLSIDGYTLGERPALAAVQREGIISAAFIPIKVREACYGIIGCVSRSRRLFSERDIHLLNTIGQTIGLAVEKGRLYQNARRHAMRLETIYRVSDKLTGLLELDELLPALVKLIHDTFNYYNVNMMLYDKEHRQLVFTAGCGGFQRPEPIGRRIALLEGIIGNCFQRREPILVNDVSKEPNFMYMERLPETKAELAVPLMARSSAIGVLDVQSRFVNAFDDEDLLTLQALAEQIGVAIENAQLYERIKHSLDEVRKSQAFFAKIVLESPLSTFITESDGTCILINQSALALLGTNAIYDEVIGKYNLLSDPPFAAIQLEEKILAVLAGEVVQFNVDLPAIASETKRSLRDTITLRATFFPLMDDARKVANIVAMFEDLTEKKQLEEALQQAQKMESIGTLAGGIAHDFNNILGGVLGYTSFIKTKLSKGDSLYRYIDIIETSARRAADLTQQLLAFARGGKYRVQILDLNQVVREAIELIARSIPESISLTLKLAAMLPPLEGDGGQIIQTIVNMCINARDAMEQGGQLVIATSVADVGEAFVNRHPGAKLGTYVRLTVSDTGSGMSEETKQRIFEPFFTTKKDRKGTGLGLAMVYGIIKNHGGYIDVESEPGKGTAFLIHLPISSKPFENTARPTSRLPKFGRETILVAEDEDMMRDLIVEMLDSGGYQVISVDNGRKALDVYRERAREIDLVILDMIMPDLGGQEAFRQLKEINPGVKVLFSSGYSQDSQAQQIMSEGVLGFIQKPYAINELLDKIRLIIDCM